MFVPACACAWTSLGLGGWSGRWCLAPASACPMRQAESVSPIGHHLGAHARCPMRQARVTGLMVTETERAAAFLTVLLRRCWCVYSFAGVEGDARQVHWQQALQAQQVDMEGAGGACGQGQQAASSSSCGSWWGGGCQGAEGWPPRQIPCAHPAAQVSSACARVAAPQGVAGCGSRCLAAGVCWYVLWVWVFLNGDLWPIGCMPSSGST